MAPSFLMGFIAVSSLTLIVGASQQSALFRDRQINYGNFKRDWGKRLTAENIKSFLVNDHELECPFMCVSEPRCLSFNVATYPTTRGLYVCEVLATDKYRAKNALQTNATFQHYSPLVSKIEFLLYMFRRYDVAFQHLLSCYRETFRSGS